MKHYVLEPHVDGTKQYGPGDEREGDEHELRHLVDLGVLSTTKPEKAEGAAPANKAEGRMPANKAG